MALGRKTGGRQRGVPNKRTVEIADKLAALGCDPITGMAHMAMDNSYPPELRAKMYSELAQYLYPKRKAADGGLDDTPKVTFIIDTAA